MTTSMAACSYTNPGDTTTLIVGASTNPAPATKSIQQNKHKSRRQKRRLLRVEDHLRKAPALVPGTGSLATPWPELDCRRPRIKGGAFIGSANHPFTAIWSVSQKN